VLTIDDITKKLRTEFDKLHAKFKTVSISHLKELNTELTTWRQEGIISKKFYEQNYGLFVFQPPETVHNAHSIIIIGIPQKVTRIAFFYKGKQYQTIIPPTYRFTQIRAKCTDILTKVFRNKGYAVDRAIVPLKLLAVRSGLGTYGKNNLCYVKGMGSYTRLEAFYTNYDFPTDDWGEKQLMTSCQSCTLCQHACPTRCIPSDRMLIHANQCLTYFNENTGDFPAAIPAQAHHALIGCMRCQLVCPQNKDYFGFTPETIIFTEEETASILQQTPRDSISHALRKKLIDLDMYEDYPELPRNIAVLITKAGSDI